MLNLRILPLFHFTGSEFVTKEAGRQPLQQVGSNNMTSSSSFEPFVFKGSSQENLSQSQPLRVPNLSRSNSTVSINKSKSCFINGTIYRNIYTWYRQHHLFTL